MAESMKITAFWDIAPCNLVEVDPRFRGAYCIIRSFALTTRWCIPEGCSYFHISSLVIVLPAQFSHLGGVIVRVLGIGPKVCGFKLDRGRFLMAIEIRNTPSFDCEVKPSAPYRKNLRHVKNHLEVWTKILRRLNSSFPSPNSFWFATRWMLIGLPYSSGWRIEGFPSRYHSTMVLHTHVTWGWTIGPLVAAVQRRSLTTST
jgi:hypothetical protein